MGPARPRQGGEVRGGLGRDRGALPADNGQHQHVHPRDIAPGDSSGETLPHDHAEAVHVGFEAGTLSI